MNKIRFLKSFPILLGFAYFLGWNYFFMKINEPGTLFDSLDNKNLIKLPMQKLETIRETYILKAKLD